MSAKYPRICKIEVLDDRGTTFIVLYDMYEEEDDTDAYRDNQGPNYMYEVDTAHPDCPGFRTFMEEAKAYDFTKWKGLPFVAEIRYGEAAAEYMNIHQSNHRLPLVIRWREDVGDGAIEVLDKRFSAWANR